MRERKPGEFPYCFTPGELQRDATALLASHSTPGNFEPWAARAAARLIDGRVALQLGQSLGPYEIIAPIGAGGMGEVYRARDTRLKRDVAIQICAARFSERFEGERETYSVESGRFRDIPSLPACAGSNEYSLQLIKAGLQSFPTQRPREKVKHVIYIIQRKPHLRSDTGRPGGWKRRPRSDGVRQPGYTEPA